MKRSLEPTKRDIKSSRKIDCEDFYEDYKARLNRIDDNINRLPKINTEGSDAFADSLHDFIDKSDDKRLKEVMVLTNKDLEGELIKATRCLEDELKGQKWIALTMNITACVEDPDTVSYQDSTAYFKSNDWIVKNALLHMHHHPYCVADRSTPDASVLEGDKNYVLIDDASYSGAQVVNSLINSGYYNSSRLKNFYIVCLFMTEKAIEAVENYVKYEVENYYSDTAKRPKVVCKKISETESWRVYRHPRGFDVHLYRARIIPTDRTVFEHKLPDDMSFDRKLALKILHIMPLSPYKDSSQMVDDYDDETAIRLPCIDEYLERKTEMKRSAYRIP